MSRIAKEIAIFVFCAVVAFATNVWSIATFHTQWSELYTTLHITLAIGLALYIVLAVLRLLAFVVFSLLGRRTA